MGWKLVRNSNQKHLQEFISGEWRVSPDPIGALVKKLGEEYGEFAEDRDPGELYDVLDVLKELVHLLDEHGEASRVHERKLARMGDFSDHIEWHPNPHVELRLPPEERGQS